MGSCIYCNQKAGFLKSKHKTCDLKHKQGILNFKQTLKEAIVSSKDFTGLLVELDQIATDSFISDSLKASLRTQAFDLAVDVFLEDGILSEQEEEQIYNFKSVLSLSQDDLDQNGSLTKVVMASVLRELVNGEIPEPRIKADSQLPFLFQKSEKLIWIFAGVEYYEQKTRTEYRGGSQGVSIRVAKGVYYRTSSFKGRPIQISELQHIDNGIFALTSKHIYFSGGGKSFKVPFAKIVSLDPYEDGIGIMKDGVRAKPQLFKGVDGWFVQNAISNLSQL